MSFENIFVLTLLSKANLGIFCRDSLEIISIRLQKKKLKKESVQETAPIYVCFKLFIGFLFHENFSFDSFIQNIAGRFLGKVIWIRKT